VSRTRCSVQRCCAERHQEETDRCTVGPGSAAHRWRSAALRPGQRDAHKSSKEKGRPVSRAAFPVSRRLHIHIGRFRSFQTGGLSPDRVLVGGRCISGQSRAVARTERDGLPSP